MKKYEFLIFIFTLLFVKSCIDDVTIQQGNKNSGYMFNEDDIFSINNDLSDKLSDTIQTTSSAGSSDIDMQVEVAKKNEEFAKLNFKRFEMGAVEVTGYRNLSKDYRIISNLQGEDPYFKIFKSEQLLVYSKFSKKESEWIIKDGSYDDPSMIIDNHEILNNIYMPVYSVVNKKYNKKIAKNDENKVVDYVKNDVTNNISGSCSGQTYRGQATGSSRSRCCYKATNNVHHMCTNEYCMGCCMIYSCDSACGMGSYFCFCGTSGVACSEEDSGGGGGSCPGDMPCKPIPEYNELKSL